MKHEFGFLIHSRVSLGPWLSALREPDNRMTMVWARHMHAGSALRGEAGFAMNLSFRLLDLHQSWCARCRNRAN
jgi:hypothetical protein